jgi:spoIIIJ-associated protein
VVPAEEAVPEEVLETPSDMGNQAKELLGQLLKFIDEAAQVEIRETTQEIQLEILGNGSGLFIGKRGATLEALQHLVAKMLGLDRRSGKRILVDSEHYRARRQQALEGLARRLASRARREGRPISVEPMSAIDRRILHLALKNDREVITKSVGEGSNRKVVVVPRRMEGDLDEKSLERRAAQSNRRGPRRGGSNDERRTRGGRPQGGRPQGARPQQRRQRPLPPGRMHDSFDVPSVPEDMFENDEDVLSFEEQENTEAPPPPETTEKEE